MTEAFAPTLADVLAGVAAAQALDMHHKFGCALGWRAYFRPVWQHRGEGIPRVLHKGLLHDALLPEGACARLLPTDIRQACMGVPVVDEAARTLCDTGMLHNHARMRLARDGMIGARDGAR